MSLLPEDVKQRLEDAITQRGLVLLELKQRGERSSSVIEVVVDAEHDVNLDVITEISREISAMLDEVEDRLPSRYRLEVSSAGLSRPLEYDWQFRKNIGRLVKLTFEDETGVVRTEVFRLVDAPGHVLIVRSKAKKPKGDEPSLTIPLDRMKRAVIEPEF